MAVIKMNFLSQALGMQTNVTICLPTFSFADIMAKREEVYVPGMKYQVMYLLHGTSGDDSDYLNFSNITRYADDHKLAVVMPAGFNSDYTDFPGGAKYLTYITEELPKMCQSIFPFSDKREDNFIAGLSMGSHGAMKIALMYPERYCAALIMSGAARRPDTIKAFVEQRNKGMGPLPVPDLSKVYDLEHYVDGPDDAYGYAKRNVKEGKPLPKLIFTVGGDDGVKETALWGYEEMKKLGYEAEYIEVPGYRHEWDFWDLSLRNAIKDWLPIRHSVIYPGE